MKLVELPDDVIAHVARFLAHEDLCALLQAVLGHSPSMWSREGLVAVPVGMRSEWLAHSILNEFRDFLHSLSPWGLFHSRECMVVCAMINWSPFSNRPPDVIAEYSWKHGPPRPNVVIHDRVLHACMLWCVRQRLPQVCVTLHSLLRWDGQTILCPTPMHRTHHTLFPYFCL